MPAWCPHCGTMMPEGLDKCPKCGKSLERDTRKDPDKLSSVEIRIAIAETFRILLIPIVFAIVMGVICYWLLNLS
jgi:uncharacterized membrane protein YvbJ